MKRFKKAAHCLFVEEETYNWAPARSAISTRAVILVLLFAIVGAVLASIAT